mmetsp:Transcript_6978/g.9069  ORF Transcript_6978/g.9069 Transcript_6978/m.9069 type:complete len:436 (+) Transcript_6978:222-1529(+)
MVGFTLEGAVKRADKMLRKMADPKYVKADKVIPTTLLRNCEGVAFITIFKAGLFVFGGNVGGGCVIAKVKDPDSPGGYRWSGPCALQCGGLGGGFIFGGEKIDSIVILNTKSAVRAFMGKGQVTFGGNVSLAVGPVGRDIEAHVGVSDSKELLAAYSYSQAQGAYIGGTLEGAFMGIKKSENRKFYSADVSAEEILTGKVQIPFQAQGLVNRLTQIMSYKRAGTGDMSSASMSNSGESMNVGASPVTINQQPSLGPQYTSNSDSLSFSNGHNTSIPAAVAKPVSDPNPFASNASRAVPRPSPPNLPPMTDLPPGWKKFISDDGKPYYHNTVTNETQWDKPTRSVARPPPPKAPQSIVTASVPPNVPSRPSARPYTSFSKNFALAIYDFSATRPDELTFKKDSKLEIMDKSSADWWKAKAPNGSVGLVPANYLKPI